MDVPPSSCCARPLAGVARVPPVSSHPPPLWWDRNCSPGGGRRLWLVTPTCALEGCGQACLPVLYPSYLFPLVFLHLFSHAHSPVIALQCIIIPRVCTPGASVRHEPGIKNNFSFPLLLTSEGDTHLYLAPKQQEVKTKKSSCHCSD